MQFMLFILHEVMGVPVNFFYEFSFSVTTVMHRANITGYLLAGVGMYKEFYMIVEVAVEITFQDFNMTMYLIQRIIKWQS